MILDLDKLHNVNFQTKQSGRTTAMLVDAIHQADFYIVKTKIRIVLATTLHAEVVQLQFLRLARALEFDITVTFQQVIKLKETFYVFMVPYNMAHTRGFAETFIDHYVYQHLKGSLHE